MLSEIEIVKGKIKRIKESLEYHKHQVSVYENDLYWLEKELEIYESNEKVSCKE